MTGPAGAGRGHHFGEVVFDIGIADVHGPLADPGTLAGLLARELLPAIEAACAALDTADAVAAAEIVIDLGHLPADPDWATVRAELSARLHAALVAHPRPEAARPGGGPAVAAASAAPSERGGNAGPRAAGEAVARRGRDATEAHEPALPDAAERTPAAAGRAAGSAARGFASAADWPSRPESGAADAGRSANATVPPPVLPQSGPVPRAYAGGAAQSPAGPAALQETAAPGALGSEGAAPVHGAARAGPVEAGGPAQRAGRSRPFPAGPPPSPHAALLRQLSVTDEAAWAAVLARSQRSDIAGLLADLLGSARAPRLAAALAAALRASGRRDRHEPEARSDARPDARPRGAAVAPVGPEAAPRTTAPEPATPPNGSTGRIASDVDPEARGRQHPRRPADGAPAATAAPAAAPGVAGFAGPRPGESQPTGAPGAPAPPQTVATRAGPETRSPAAAITGAGEGGTGEPRDAVTVAPRSRTGAILADDPTAGLGIAASASAAALPSWDPRAGGPTARIARDTGTDAPHPLEPWDPASNTTTAPATPAPATRTDDPAARPTRDAGSDTLRTREPRNPANSATAVPAAPTFATRTDDPTARLPRDTGSDAPRPPEPRNPANSATAAPAAPTSAARTDDPTVRLPHDAGSDDPRPPEPWHPANSATAAPAAPASATRTDDPTARLPRDTGSDAPRPPEPRNPANSATAAPAAPTSAARTDDPTVRLPHDAGSDDPRPPEPWHPANSATAAPAAPASATRADDPTARLPHDAGSDDPHPLEPWHPANRATAAPATPASATRTDDPTARLPHGIDAIAGAPNPRDTRDPTRGAPVAAAAPAPPTTRTDSAGRDLGATGDAGAGTHTPGPGGPASGAAVAPPAREAAPDPQAPEPDPAGGHPFGPGPAAEPARPSPPPDVAPSSMPPGRIERREAGPRDEPRDLEPGAALLAAWRADRSLFARAVEGRGPAELAALLGAVLGRPDGEAPPLLDAVRKTAATAASPAALLRAVLARVVDGLPIDLADPSLTTAVARPGAAGNPDGTPPLRHEADRPGDPARRTEAAGRAEARNAGREAAEPAEPPGRPEHADPPAAAPTPASRAPSARTADIPGPGPRAGIAAPAEADARWHIVAAVLEGAAPPELAAMAAAVAEDAGRVAALLGSRADPARIGRLVASSDPPSLRRLLGHLRPGFAARELVALDVLWSALPEAMVGADPDRTALWRFALRAALGQLPPSGGIAGLTGQAVAALAGTPGAPPDLARRLLDRLETSRPATSPAAAAQVATGLSRLLAAPADPEAVTEDLRATRTAGLVLVAPYLPMLFERLELTGRAGFLGPEATVRGLDALHAVAYGGAETRLDDRPLERLLCGVPEGEPLRPPLPLAPPEAAIVADLLATVVARWTALGATSVDGLRQAFLLRDGLLRRTDAGHALQVAPKAYDMLLDRLPWSIALVKLAWMPAPIHVAWRK